MLAALLPLLEALGAEGGASASLGAGSGVGRTLGRLLGGGGGAQAFGNQQELGGALRQISDLTTNISAAQDAMKQMRSEHETLGTKAREDERLYGMRDPMEAQRMADLQRQQMEHARQVQQQQREMQNLQARAAVTMDPALAAQQARGRTFRQAGAMAVAGQAVQSFGPSAMRNFPGVQGAANLFGFAAGDENANIAGQMGNQAAGAVSNVAGGAMKGAAMGSMAGPIGAGVGAAVGGTVAAAGEIAKLPSLIKGWGEALVESQRPLARFSGELSRAAAQREVSQLRRDITSANITGGTTSDLSDSLNNLNDTLRPVKDVMTMGTAAVLTDLVKVLSEGVKVVGGALDQMAEFTDAITLGLAHAKDNLAAWKVIVGSDGPKAPPAAELKRILDEFKGRDRSIPRGVPRR